MSLRITIEAAAFLREQIGKAPDTMRQPLRLKCQSGKGAGDVGHLFTYAARLRESDVEVTLGGLTIYCDIDECPSFEHSLIAMAPRGERVVVMPGQVEVATESRQAANVGS